MTGPIRADVYLDGDLMASTAEEFYGGHTTVLSGLKIDWGRSTAVDQPEPSSLTLTFAQNQGRADFLRSLAVGRQVDVTASGTIPTGATQNTMTQGDFEDPDAPSVLSSNAAVSVTTAQAHTGSQSALVRAVNPSQDVVTVFPPVPFSGDLTAWDTVPRMSAGELWTLSAWARALPGSTVTVEPVWFSAPDGTYSRPGGAVTLPGSGAWQEFALDVPNFPGVWVGVMVTVHQIGPAWAAVPGTWTAQGSARWVDYNVAYIDTLEVLAPEGGTVRTVLAFRGRVTDMEARWVPTLAGGTTQVDVTAKDFTADLANNRIGDVPWSVEALGDRVNRILELAGTGVAAQIDDSVYATQVTYRDVDSQPASGLVTELAASVAAVAWPVVHDPGGESYWIEDPRNRVALFMLHLNTSTGQVEIIPNPYAAQAILLDSSNVLEDPIRWSQDVADVATRANITWLEQGVDEEGQPETTERHHVTVNADLEEVLGQRAFSLTTQLISDADAGRVATTLLASQHAAEWRVSGVTWSIRYEDVMTRTETISALDLLDGTVRIGHPLTITRLPAWVPVLGTVVVYIEGGGYEFTDGDWILELVASASGQGQSVTWDELSPSWPWTNFQNLSWLDLIGVGPAPTER